MGDRFQELFAAFATTQYELPGETIHEVDEPRLVSPTEVATIPARAAKVMDWLGFRYLLLHQFADPGGGYHLHRRREGRPFCGQRQ